MPALNTKRLVGEVASRYGIRLDETDPAFVVVQLTQFALEETSRELIERVAVERREFEAAAQKYRTGQGDMLRKSSRRGPPFCDASLREISPRLA